MAISRTTSRFLPVWKAIGITCFLVALGGCSADGPKSPPSSEGEILFGGGKSATNAGESFWTIGLKPFAGEGARLRAEQERARLRELPGLGEVFVLERGPRVIVCIGKVSSPASAEAESLLQRVRGVSDGGTKPFANAFYLPPVGQPASNLDLRSVPQPEGRRSTLYTLQVGAYGRADGTAPSEKEIREVRQKAEEAATELRRQGELAFYYHGPSMSMVTVGVFGERDIQDAPSFELRELMERFPHNLYNGQGVNQTVLTTDGRQEKVLQPSFLVLIPPP